LFGQLGVGGALVRQMKLGKNGKSGFCGWYSVSRPPCGLSLVFRTILDDSVLVLAFCLPPLTCALLTGNILIKAFDLAAFGWRIMNVGQKQKRAGKNKNDM